MDPDRAGDYKTSSYRAPKRHPNVPAAILLDKPSVYVRGMSRTQVIIDGTKPGTPRCSSRPSAQNYGPKYNGRAAGLNGIEVWEANDVWVQDLTTRNFTGGSGDTATRSGATAAPVAATFMGGASSART